MNILITGALTGKVIGLPSENIGLVLEMFEDQASFKGYPAKFTRICFKEELANKIKFTDCKESVEEILTQMGK